MSQATVEPAPRRDRSRLIVFSAVFAAMAGYGITLTVLPDATARVHGLGAAGSDQLRVHVALLTSVYPLAQLLASPFVGRWADRRGRRRVLLVGLAGSAAAQAAFGLVRDVGTMYAARAAAGIAAAALLVAASAFVADAASDDGRARAMGWFGAAVSLGLVAGPALGGLIGRAGVDERIGPVRIDDLSLPFLATALLLVLAFEVARRHAREPRTGRGTASSSTAQPGRLRPLLALVAASQFGLALFEGTVVLYTRDRLAIDAGGAATVFVVCGLVMAALQPAAGTLMRSGRAEIVGITAGLALMSAGTASLAVAGSFRAVLALVAVLAAGTALVTPGLSARIARLGGAQAASALGWRNAVGGIGQFAGPLVGGGLLVWQSTAPFLLSGAVLLGAAVASWGHTEHESAPQVR